MAEFCVHERHGGICEKTGTYCNLGSCPYEDLQKFAPVRHGRWEGYSHSRYCGIDDFGDPIYKDGVVYYCSVCRRRTVIKERYCPNCGADMRGSNDE